MAGKKTLSNVAKHIHKGALRRKAQAAGESTMSFAREHAHSPGKTGKQARLALTFAKHRPGRRGRKSGRK